MSLRDDAIAIWKSGVAAVDSGRLCARQIQVDASSLTIAGHRFDLNAVRRIEVVGAGKAGAGMAAGIERALNDLPQQIHRSGWLNVPEDCVQPTDWIHLHAARPAGLNEPTEASVSGTKEILRRIANLGDDDICIVLLSGGGSALLCAPIPSISLQDKVATTRLLASNGVPIHELNAVRTRLSLVKGGGLVRHCRAGTLIALIVSDVVGDPLETIASGPAIPSQIEPADALKLIRDRGISERDLSTRVRNELHAADQSDTAKSQATSCRVYNHIIGSNQVAMTAAAEEAECRGYRVQSLGSANEGEASEEGRQLFERLKALQHSDQTGVPLCLLSGGEPTVKLADVSVPGKGGRNQELVLAAIHSHPVPSEWAGMAILSGGTDGEDGPTDAAGAVADERLLIRMVDDGISPEGFLRINNSYPFFDRLDGLLQTGPTHTNVMDLRVGLVVPPAVSAR